MSSFLARVAGVCCAVVSLGVGSSDGATFTVINTNNTGVGSLRTAITNALATTGPNSVEFDIPGAGPHTIKVTAALPFITNSTSIRGDTQPGYTNTPLIHIAGPSTNAVNDFGLYADGNSVTIRAVRCTGFKTAGVGANGFKTGIAIQGCLLDGNGDGLSGGGSGLTVGGTNAALRNVIINNQTNGILLYNGNTRIRGNFIGVDADGATPAGNGENGIRLFYLSGTNTIEGGANYPQVISGNGQAGILCEPNSSYINSASDNIIRGNLIGTDATGTNAVPNNTGIRVWGGNRNTIGGTLAAHRNVIAGNLSSGISIEGLPLGLEKGTNNVVIGNYIGLGADGETVLSNYYGVQILDTQDNRIGGTAAGSGNRFGGATFYNVRIDSVFYPCFSNTVQGNWFGISVSTQRLHAGPSGLRLGGSSHNLIGGTNAAARNYFGGANTGVNITGTNAQHNRVIGNWIGLGPGGVQMANNSYGVDIFNASRNQIGGVYSSEANVISGNEYYGVYVHGTNAYGNVVEGNIVGLDPTSLFAISNRYTGIEVSGGAYSNRIGGTSASTMNVVGGNGGSGIGVSGPATYGNWIQFNLVGISRTNFPVGNKYIGIEVGDAPRNTIGPFNYVGNSVREGINIWGPNAISNVVRGNIIGQDPDGTAQPNALGGVGVRGAPHNQIGINGSGNYIGGNTGAGISAYWGASNVTIQGNRIGLRYPDGTNVQRNTSYGISIDDPGATIGGTNAGDVNYVSGNSFAGILLGTGAANARVSGNIIGLDVNGLSVTNSGPGIRIDAKDVFIGATPAYGRNIISGNLGHGVEILANASNVTLVNNYIGTDLSGLTSRRNSGRGILSAGSAVTIGGTGPQEGNLIGCNSSHGIEVHTGRQVRIYGNSIGVGADGFTVVTNGSMGIVVSGDAREVVIGTTNGTGGNVVARNQSTEISIVNNFGGTRVEGNFIGVQNFGVAFPAAQSGFAIDVTNAPNNLILNNVIGQNDVGIRLNGTGTFNNVIQGNYIGEYQLEPLSNLSWGIWIINSSSNVIGGLTAGERNLIAHNLGGVAVTNSGGFVAVANRIAANLIYSNRTRLNIELGPNGFNTNDVLDADEGANRLQNHPALTNAITLFPNAGIVYAQGLLHSTPLRTFAVDVYRSGGTNAEGRIHLGRTLATTDAAGDAPFTAGFALNLAAGTYLTATVTDPEGNTSEFAATPTGAVFKATADGDNDGIPDYWEALYGLNPGISNAPGSDLDGDGFSDLNEYIADTAANNSNAFPFIVSISNAVARSVSFPSSNLRAYHLHGSDDVAGDPAWMQLSAAVTGAFGYTTLVDTNLVDDRAYRVGVRLP